MTPESANRLALEAVRRIVGAAHPFEVRVADKTVRVIVTGQEPYPWPRQVPGLDATTDGPWPPRVLVRAEWDGGKAGFEVVALAGAKRREGRVVIAVRILPRRRHLGFSNVGAALLASDEAEVPVANWFQLKKRESGPRQAAKSKKLAEFVLAAQMPMLAERAVELFRVRVDDGAVLPSPETAFERVLHINLLKLDFFSRGRALAERGSPLIDLASLGLEDASDDDDEEEDEEERSYWAGGAGSTDDVEQFVRAEFWQLGLPRDSDTRGARESWKRFDEIDTGDWLAIKSVGGENQITVHSLGEVTEVNRETGRVDFKPLPRRRLYKGTLPRGSGAGTWLDPIVPVTRDEVIDLIFKAEAPDESLAWSGPFNLILYGPPGTGKTYRLREDYFPKFTRAVGQHQLDADAILELPWFELIAAALADSAGEASAMELREHVFVKTKYRAKDHKAPIGARIWATLQAHTIEASKTVDYARRFGRLVFDKRADGTWFFPDGVPEDIAELAEQLRPQPAEVIEDYSFVTFHQSYAYEDFIEGIRPKTAEGDDEVQALSYELEDGVFMQAANAAVRLAGFDGTVHDLCRRPRHERERVFDHARPYAVFIDEINRGNVSRIFGELITLIEDDKRLGAPGELMATLPYSRRRFGVPKNLVLIGTMNTADRSVEALDTALRRRFAFEECPPDMEPLKAVVVGGVEIPRMLETINRRLEVLIDRDHVIGHAYFQPLVEDPSITKLKDVFRFHVLPLLTEYFYSDLGRIGLVLGSAFVERVRERVGLAVFEHDSASELAERAVFRLRGIDSLTNADFRRIYDPEA